MRAMKLPRRSGLASRPSGPSAPSRLVGPEVAVDHGLMSTSSAGAAEVARRPPRRRLATPATTSGRASARTAAARRRSPRPRGRRRAPSRCRPTARATTRSKPAWRSWPRMNSAMMRRATSVSIAQLGGQLEARRRRSLAPDRPACRSGDVEARLGADRRRSSRSASPARSRDDAVELADARPPDARRAAAAARSAPGGCRPGRCRRGTGPRRRAAPEQRASPSGPTTSEPPQKLIDSSTPTRLTKTT